MRWKRSHAKALSHVSADIDNEGHMRGIQLADALLCMQLERCNSTLNKGFRKNEDYHDKVESVPLICRYCSNKVHAQAHSL